MRLLKNRIARMYAECDCVHPVQVITLTGKRVVVACGRCVICLHKRRNVWSKRLQDEYKHPRCLHSFGFTLTYDSHNVPYLPLKDLKSQTYDYESPNNSHTYLNVLRGCDPRTLSNKQNVGLLSSRDIELYIKKLRKAVETEFPNLFIRYFISGEYGEIDEIGRGYRTGRPHYHGIIYVFFKQNKEVLDSYVKNYICSKVEQFAMDAWSHSVRFFDKKKGIYVGKDIHTFGERWGSYLGRYINKENTEKMDGCLGCRWIPERVWCSRRSDKYGLGSIGFSSLDEISIYDYLQKIADAEKNNTRLNLTYNENGFTKSLPKAYISCLYERFFGVRMARVQSYIYWTNYHAKASENLKFYLRLTNVDIVDPGDPFGILTISVPRCDISQLIPEKWYKPVNPNRSLFSISCMPPHEPDEYFVEVTKEPYFSRTERDRIERYLRFRDQQTYLWYTSFADNGSYNHQFLVNENELLQAIPKVTNVLFFRGLSQKRKETISKANRLFEQALQAKHYHEVKNGYIAC